MSDSHQKLVCLLGSLHLLSYYTCKHLPVLSSFTNLTSLGLPFGDGHIFAEDISRLHQLPLLHSLDLPGCAEVSSILAMPCLRCLKMSGLLNNTYDFSCATQITQLTLAQEEERRGFSHLTLPSENNVQLLQLSLGSWQETPIDTLINLGAATSLESLYIDIFTDNGDAFWPASMPALTDLATHVMPQQPPIKWLNYTNLRGLTLEDLESPVIPDWFSAFTQLTSLSLEGAELKDFPSCVMQLSHLRSLSFKDIDQFEYPLELPPVIVEFAQWPYLSRLNFALSSRVYSTESQHSLSQLKAALGHRSSLLIL